MVGTMDPAPHAATSLAAACQADWPLRRAPPVALRGSPLGSWRHGGAAGVWGWLGWLEAMPITIFIQWLVVGWLVVGWLGMDGWGWMIGDGWLGMVG